MWTATGPDKSSRGVIIRRACHLIRHSSTLQSAIGLSSAASEDCALTKGAAYSLGSEADMRDLCLKARIA
eukprot:12929779-Prorocentrum_lima.AAC.1